MSDVEPAYCHDCGQDTAPCTGQRGCRHKGRWEWYTVHDHLWPADRWSIHDYLCVGCLERRLGRILTPADFKDVPCNLPDPWDTPRLAARKAGVPFDDRDGA